MNTDLVILGGRVFTGHAGSPFLDAVASSGDRIVAVGAEAIDMASAAKRVIDLDGAMAAPGFIDAHVHPFSGLDKLRCNFDGVSNAEEAVERIAVYARSNPDVPWILGGGWPQSWFSRGCPSKELIDPVVSDRPVLLTNTDGHGAWANSRALEWAGIDASTPDPSDGRIERLDDGTPQGTLHEGAVQLVTDVAPDPTPEETRNGLLRGQEELFRYGVTGWQDAGIRPDSQKTYLDVAEDGRLLGRVVGALWWERDRGLEQIDELVARREESAPGFRPTSVKLMLDGVAENFTASMLESYLGADGRPTGNTGIDFIDPAALPEIVTKLDALGFQCHFHVIGDGAVRSGLNAVEAALDTNGPNDNRHHLAHIQVVHPDDIARFAALGVVANAQPLWACNDEYQTDLTRPYIGEERSSWQYPFGSLRRSGARIAMGSDWDVSTCNVMEEVDVAVTRTGDTGIALNPEEALDAVDALAAFTSGSAYVNHAELDSGSIALGKLADFAVLDRDPFRDGPFREVRVVTTVLGGEVVYEDV